MALNPSSESETEVIQEKKKMESLKNSETNTAAEVAASSAASAASHVKDEAKKNMDFIMKNLLAGGRFLFWIEIDLFSTAFRGRLTSIGGYIPFKSYRV